MTSDWRIIQGDCREVMAGMAEKSCHMCVTSPPYFGLRDYKLPEGETRGIGLEATLDEYINSIREVFADLHRVLRDDGTVWIVVGDRIIDGQFAGITWKLAEALKTDGWLLRCPIVWFKIDANMDSTRSRPRIRHEYIFVFSKQAKHYFDQYAVDHLWRGSVWPIATSNVKAAHYAPFPRQLVDNCVRLATSERGCCSECGRPWIRQIKSERVATRPSIASKYAGVTLEPGRKEKENKYRCDRRRHVRTNMETLGWAPGCWCAAPATLAGARMVLPDVFSYPPISCAVLDPFCGIGTVGVVATQLGRRFVGIEISEDYCRMAEARIRNPEPEPVIPDVKGQMTMWDDA